MKATVLIPTKNAGPSFRTVLDRLMSQHTSWPFEVIVIDSGSSDGTVDLCRQYPAIRLHQIAPTEFGHGRTRNLGFSIASGEFVAVITQDALPVDDHWLTNLVAAVEARSDIAGGFGRHLPYNSASPFIKRDLQLHFDGFAKLDPITKLDDPVRYAQDLGYRQLLHFFSDNNACIRKAVWEKFPYPDVDFAEDQIWAQRIIEAGYAKVYCDAAAVYHSHDYGVIETLRRSYDESRAFRRLFGYRLCPSFRHLLAVTAHTTVRDLRYARKIVGARAKWLVLAPPINLAKQAGYYLGSEWSDHPFVSRLSLDRAKKVGTRVL
jgi:rhamnosyltransferase